MKNNGSRRTMEEEAQREETRMRMKEEKGFGCL